MDDDEASAPMTRVVVARRLRCRRHEEPTKDQSDKDHGVLVRVEAKRWHEYASSPDVFA
ncbi:MAG TPA: hypothetical protein VM370_01305 [Candidatus Thermoplasmatota archaeon]|nr:hypothetical protein [Candidatus Thermoplasmatota archaeon]